MGIYRVAVLECDTPMQPIIEQNGTYGDIFRDFLQQGLAQYAQSAPSVHIELQVTKKNVVEDSGFPDLSSVNCILLTGSSKYSSWRRFGGGGGTGSGIDTHKLQSTILGKTNLGF